jgi:predicted transposase/invertase (TIGR01784 family)
MQRPRTVADAWAMTPAPTPFERLDPKLDIVFKLLLVRTQLLLVDMLEAVLGRPIASVTVLNPDILGELASDKRVVLDIRVTLADGARVDVEMQARTTPALRSRLVYYATRDHSSQLSPGDGYEELTPTVVIAWLVEPIPELPHRLHTVYGLRAEHTNERFSDQLAIHVLQLSALPAEDTEEYAVSPQVKRWARFLAARTDAEYEQLALEDPIMAIAKQALDELSQDPFAHRLARERADAVKLYQMDLVSWGRKARVEGLAEGLAEGEAKILLKQLERRFGPPTGATRAHVQSASVEQLETWAERILDAQTLDEVLAP